LKIPRNFRMMGRTIDVVFDELLIHRTGNNGEANFNENKVTLQKPSGSTPAISLSEDYMGELAHWALHLMGEDDLTADEKFVHTFARLMHQATEGN
jgi:hypothetical protein